jgi:hypothetical protein
MVAAASAAAHDDIVNCCSIETNTILQAIENLSKDALRVHVMKGAGVFALSSW